MHYSQVLVTGVSTAGKTQLIAALAARLSKVGFVGVDFKGTALPHAVQQVVLSMTKLGETAPSTDRTGAAFGTSPNAETLVLSDHASFVLELVVTAGEEEDYGGRSEQFRVQVVNPVVLDGGCFAHAVAAAFHRLVTHGSKPKQAMEDALWLVAGLKAAEKESADQDGHANQKQTNAGESDRASDSMARNGSGAPQVHGIDAWIGNLGVRIRSWTARTLQDLGRKLSSLFQSLRGAGNQDSGGQPAQATWPDYLEALLALRQFESESSTPANGGCRCLSSLTIETSKSLAALGEALAKDQVYHLDRLSERPKSCLAIVLSRYDTTRWCPELSKMLYKVVESNFGDKKPQLQGIPIIWDWVVDHRWVSSTPTSSLGISYQTRCQGAADHLSRILLAHVQRHDSRPEVLFYALAVFCTAPAVGTALGLSSVVSDSWDLALVIMAAVAFLLAILLPTHGRLGRSPW